MILNETLFFFFFFLRGIEYSIKISPQLQRSTTNWGTN
jgi:hypothetical protein